MPPLEERVEYDYMNIRSKKFFWGDGDKVSSLNTRLEDTALSLSDSILGVDSVVSLPPFLSNVHPKLVSSGHGRFGHTRGVFVTFRA